MVQSDLREAEIRPPRLLNRFRELSIEDAREFFGSPEGQIEVDCPACGQAGAPVAFEKNGFKYRLCATCGSLYVSPRPTAARLADYYRSSRAAQYRAEHLARETSAARRVRVIHANAYWMGRLVDEAGKSGSRIYGDLGTNYPVLFEEIAQLGLFDQYFSIEPFHGLAESCRQAGAVVAAEAPAGLAALTAFEQLEHQFSPREMLDRARGMLAPGGQLFLTTRTASGFDIQTLWDKAPYIYVPEHLNLLSIEGLERLIEGAGFDLIESSTPGQLDIELTQAAAAADPTVSLPRFIDLLLNRRDAEAREDFQALLQKHRLSSHVRIAAMKKLLTDCGK
ncbi:class I SAM-dependent methyltransferase [bacterium]|nr:class I SAM-dependent methyltransferase [bacterium]